MEYGAHIFQRESRLKVPVLFASVFVFVIAVSAKDYNREIASQRRDLDALRGQVEAQQKEIAQLKAKKNATLEELEHLSESIALTTEYIGKLESMEKQLTAAVDETQGDLKDIQGRLDSRSAIMALRVRRLFMSGPPEKTLFNLPIASQGSDQSDFLRKVYWVKRTVRYDHQLALEAREDMGLKRESLERLQSRQDELRVFQQRKREEVDRFTRAKTDQEQTLRTLQRSEVVKSATLKRLQENARQLTNIIAALEKRRKQELARNPNKKPRRLEVGTRYCSPIDGPVVSRYGMQFNAVLGTQTRNLGTEIEAKPGTPVRAAVSGEVALITPIPGYGQGIILDNGSGYLTIYANLSDIRVSAGDKVKTCQEIASEAADPGRVYFEVRKGTETLDPVAWLRGN